MVDFRRPGHIYISKAGVRQLQARATGCFCADVCMCVCVFACVSVCVYVCVYVFVPTPKAINN